MTNPLSDLRAAVRSLDHVPDQTPVELTLSYGAPNAITFDGTVVRMSIGWGNSAGRPTMGQVRAWLRLPPGQGGAADLAGPWASATGREPIMTWRGAAVMASAIASGYHGVRRNGGSAFWGLIWFGLGAALPGLVPVVAAAQGYGQCANNCRRAATEAR